MTRIAHLSHRALIRITGPDWAPFLKGLCTARIDDLIRPEDSNNDGQIGSLSQTSLTKMAYGAFLRPQGKMYADCLVSPRSADEVWLDVPQTAREELLQKLNMYKLRAKVTMEPLGLAVHAAFDGPLPEGFATDPRGEVIGAGFGWSYDPQPVNAASDDWTQFRYRHGLAEAGSDFGKDELYAIDANLDLLDGIDFKKGCYVGQELTSRMKRRGQIKNRILPLRHDGRLPAGGEVLNGDRRAGEVLGSIDGASLALMRLDRLDGDLTCDGTPLNLTIPGWIAPHISTEAA